jgi:peptidoglycan/LPS O-acetylase OafA/YrhL
MLLMKELDKTSTIELRRFYVRRAYHILPAAIVFIVVVFVMFWQELRWYHMAAAALYLVNYDFAHPWFLGHLWSLSVQEQFYFLWPGVLKRWYRQSCEDCYRSDCGGAAVSHFGSLVTAARAWR